MSVTGLVVKSYGRRFIVEIEGKEYEATTRAKRVDYVCGDRVKLTIQNQEQAVIESAEPRETLFYRQDDWKTKLIAANLTRILFVMAAEPSPNEELLNRALIAAEAEHISPVIVVNKSDLPQTAALLDKLAFYQKIGYEIVCLSALDNVEKLLPYLKGQTSVLVGQSGMGKSTLTNAILPNAQARVGEISSALDSGKHTTTNATLYHIDADSDLIDSPGLQEFGIKQVPKEELIHYFPEMRPFIGQCRFHNCTHRNEPSCAVKQAEADGIIPSFRLALLQKLITSQENQTYR